MVAYVRLVKWLNNLLMNRVMLTSTSSADQKQRPNNRKHPSQLPTWQKKDRRCDSLLSMLNVKQLIGRDQQSITLSWPAIPEATRRFNQKASILYLNDDLLGDYCYCKFTPIELTRVHWDAHWCAVDLSSEDRLVDVLLCFLLILQAVRGRWGEDNDLRSRLTLLKPSVYFWRTCGCTSTSLVCEQTGHWGEGLDYIQMTLLWLRTVVGAKGV